MPALSKTLPPKLGKVLGTLRGPGGLNLSGLWPEAQRSCEEPAQRCRKLCCLESDTDGIGSGAGEGVAVGDGTRDIGMGERTESGSS